MKKKLILAALAAAMVVSLTACGGSTTDSLAEVTSGTMEMAQVEKKGLSGLCDYLQGNGVIAGDPVEMKADIIGAKDGRKYGFKFNDATVIVELYEFDLDHLDETGKKTLDSIRNNGTFQVLDKDVQAKLSASGKYVMIYTDTKTEDAHLAQKQKAESLLDEYDQQENTITVKKADKQEDNSTASEVVSTDETASASSSEAASSQA